MTTSDLHEPEATSEQNAGSDIIVCSNDCGVIYDHVMEHTAKIYDKPIILNQQDFYKTYEYSKPTKASIRKRLSNKCACSGSRLLKLVRRRLPVVSWLPVYNFRKEFLADIVAGITLAIVQIPQAMAFTMLSGASPVLGLYATFFSTAIYFFLGTSKFSSLGMAGTTALVVSQAITKRLQTLHVVDEADSNRSVATLAVDGFQIGNATIPKVVDIEQIKLEVVTTMAFIVGILQILMGLLDMGGLSVFFSEVMMRGCTMAAVLQMIIGQLPPLLGITAHRPNGPISIVYNLVEICKRIPSTNLATLIISIVCLASLLLINEGINARFKHKMKIPIPTEIILIVLSTVISYYLKLGQNYGVRILHHIPTGLPYPTPPQFSLIPQLLVDSVVVTILTFTIIMSQAKVLSSKYDCKADISQELFANGVANVVGSFFSSMPCSFAFVRCVLLIQLGAKSTLTSLVCAITLLLVLLFIAPVFEPLPHSVLAAILIVALAEILLDLKLIKTTWKSAKTDSILIVISFLAVFLLDLQYGIAVGVIASMVMVLFQTIRIQLTTLGNVPGTDIYLDARKFKKALEIDKIKIISVGGPLFFGTKDGLKKKVDKQIIRNADEYQTHETSSNNNNSIRKTSSTKALTELVYKTKSVCDIEEQTIWNPIAAVILDFSSVTFLDTAAIRMLSMMKNDLDNVAVSISIAAPTDNVLKSIEHSELHQKLVDHLYPSVHEAVKAVKYRITKMTQVNSGPQAFDNPTFVHHF